MSRKSAGPWWWKARKQWYVKLDGKQIPLGFNEAEANRQWHILEAERQMFKTGDSTPFATIADKRLAWIALHKKPKSLAIYTAHLSCFASVHGGVKVKDIRPHHLDSVIVLHKWSKATIRGFMVAVSTCLNWAVKQGHITSNPLHRRLTIPPITSRGREAVMTPEDYEVLLAHANPQLRDFMVACRNSGTRPHIVASVKAKDFDLANACWVMSEHKTDKDGEPLVVHLNDTLVALTKQLAAQYPEGVLFRNNLGNQWTDEVWGKAMAGLREQLARKGITLKGRGIMYGFRHSYATAQLEAGVPEAHVAKMLGHKSTVMLHKHYSHIGNDSMKIHLANITRVASETEAVSPSNSDSQA